MAIIVVCPNPKCGTPLTLENARAGTSLNCPRPTCNTPLRVPSTQPTDPLPAELYGKLNRLRKLLACDYLVEPCSRCLENKMVLVEISPGAKTTCYQCVHCGKKTRSPAGTPAAIDSIGIWQELQAWVEGYNRSAPAEPYSLAVQFQTPEAPLPFERTTRTTIPVNVRTEVWRRDGGKCVVCGTKHNLEFDHIIPIARGGATTAKNLQLLCQSCNQRKGAKV